VKLAPPLLKSYYGTSSNIVLIPVLQGECPLMTLTRSALGPLQRNNASGCEKFASTLRPVRQPRESCEKQCPSNAIELDLRVAKTSQNVIHEFDIIARMELSFLSDIVD
jgi:hypothetical protein